LEKKNAKLEKIAKGKRYNNGECIVIFWDRVRICSTMIH
jgi:hypothetical protein